MLPRLTIKPLKGDDFVSEVASSIGDIIQKKIRALEVDTTHASFLHAHITRRVAIISASLTISIAEQSAYVIEHSSLPFVGPHM